MIASGEIGSARALVRSLFGRLLPERVGWLHTLGAQLLFLAALQVVTGILLALVYSPSVENAHASVGLIERDAGGSLIRGLHSFGASAFVVLVLLHATRVFLFGAHKSRRAPLWRSGIALLLIVLGFGLTGYLLPWDMKGYFGTKVVVSVAASTPLVGPTLEKLVQGGPELGALTLTRFYAVHVVVLPLALVLGIGWHLFLLERLGITPPWRSTSEEDQEPLVRPFFPDHFAKDGVAVLALAVVLFVLAWRYGAPLEPRADPASVVYVPHPEWYFLGLQQLLRIFQGPWTPVGTVVIPTLAVALLALAPSVERSATRLPHERRLALGIFGAGALAAIGLTAWGARELARERSALAARIENERTATPSDTAPIDSTLAAKGERLYRALGCGGCHDAASGKGLNLPPALGYEGSRVKPGWLLAYLENPYPIRYEEDGVRPIARMPTYHLDDGEARALSAYLLSRNDPARVPPWELAGGPKIDKGREVFDQYQCSGCHRVGERGARIGPDLTHVGSRITPAFARAMVMAPGRVVPGTAMKDNGLWDEEAEALVSFLMSLR